MLTRLLCRMERAPSWLDMVFCRETGSKDEEVEVEVREAGCSIVVTGISPVLVRSRSRSRPRSRSRRLDLEWSLALETRVGTSERGEVLIYVGRSRGTCLLRSVAGQLRGGSGVCVGGGGCG